MKSRTYNMAGSLSLGQEVIVTLQQMPYTELSNIVFYDDTGSVVIASGEVKVTLSPDAVNYRTVENGTFDASDAQNEDREQPNAISLAISAKITMNVTGATKYALTLYQSE